MHQCTCIHVLTYIQYTTHTGALQLQATSTIGRKFFGLQPRTITLLGGHPYAFYRTVLNEIPVLENLETDLEYELMKKAEIDWKPSAVQLLLLGDKVEEGGGKKSEDLIGIKLSLLKKIGKHTELKCLRLFLSLLEATTDVVAHTIHKSLREGR